MQAEHLSAQLFKIVAEQAAVRNHRFNQFVEKWELTATQFPRITYHGADYAALQDVHQGLTYIVEPGSDFEPPEWFQTVMWLLHGGCYMRMVDSWPLTAGTSAPALRCKFDAEFQRLSNGQRKKFRHSVQLLLHPDKTSNFPNTFCRTLASKMHTEVCTQMDILEKPMSEESEEW